MHGVFSKGEVGLGSYAFLHNMSYDATSEIYADRHADILSRYPLFSGDQQDGQIEYMDRRIGRGNGQDVLADVPRPCWPNHVWSYDFVIDRTHEGRTFRILVVIDEFTRECLTLEISRQLRSDDVLHCLARLFVEKGTPDFIRSDNGSEFAAHAVRDWLGKVGVETLFIEPGSPWENGYCESFNGKMRDEKLNGELFYMLREAQVVLEMWRQEYNTFRPRSSLGQRPPAPVATLPRGAGCSPWGPPLDSSRQHRLTQ